MEPEVQRQFDEIRAILRETARRGEEMERRWDGAHAKAMRRMDRAEQRMDIFDKKLEATRKLVQEGMKLVIAWDKRHRAEMAELRKSQKAFFDSFRNGNGHGRGRIH
jgi:uncharacterized coiled-coil DUF342 family protein